MKRIVVIPRAIVAAGQTTNWRSRGMRGAWRSLTGSVVVCGLTALAVCAPAAWAQEGSTPLGGTGGSPLESPLVVPEAQTLLGSQVVTTAEEVILASPEAVAAREESREQFTNLNAAQATAVDGEAYPALIDHPLGGPPQLPAGQRVTEFVGADAALTELGEGRNGALESTVPMATAVSPGRWAAIDLGLSEAGGAFVAANPLVGVRIPKRFADGVQLLESGLSMTPVAVDGSGTPLGGSEGVVDGAVVLYANTQTDSDTLVKLSTFGVAVDTLLRSVKSPQLLDYEIGLPQGASMVQEEGSGMVRVVKEGATIATVPLPQVHDAAGTVVPAKMSVSGNVLSVSVDHRSGSYLYPIEADPEFNTVTETLSVGNWHFAETSGGGYTHSAGGGSLEMRHTGHFGVGDWAYWTMQTKGVSKLYKIGFRDNLGPVYFAAKEEKGYYPGTYPYLNARVMILSEGKEVAESVLSGWPYVEYGPVCVVSGSECSPATVAGNNAASFELTTVEPSNWYEENGYSEDVPFEGSIKEVVTYISEPTGTHATVSYNTSAPELDKTVNIFHTSGAWLGPNSGAFEFTSVDKGLGVAGTKVEYNGTKGWEALRTRNYLTESSCIGVQCSESESELLPYSLVSALPNGEDHIRVAADDPEPNTWSSEHGEGEATVKVDKTAPHGLTLTGLAVKGEEFELGEVEAHVKAEATDGEEPVKSSGIKSIELYIDGRETGTAAGSCPSGPCTASGEWSLNGAELGVGQHTLTVKATDNAANIATKEYLLSVYHASPLALGPGSVNPESGDYALEAADVDISGGSGALAVTRHYDSRNLKEGEEGPLGPQWTISLGSMASLEVLPDGSVMVVGPNGLTHFSVKKGGGFEAPVGDSNLTLEAVTNSKTEVIEYLFKDPAKGTTTGFTLPSGANSWMPTISKGPVATDTMTDTYETAEPEAGKKIVEPKLELAPHPTATCGIGELEKLEISAKGCRALEFAYGKETKATGENESEWNEYKGRLKEVKFIAYSPSAKAMARTTVAKYEYDKQGRLRTEWNPEISPALKTFYGYDAEGHATAVTAPGRETWALTYGTIPGDSSTGRLLKATQAPASAGLWNGKAPTNTEAPKLEGTPLFGARLGVSSVGTWNNNPLAYAYQWEDCNSSGKECTSIPGATNANYTLAAGDTGHTVVAQVSATNGGGTVVAATSASSAVKMVESEYSVPKEPRQGYPESIVAGPENTLWFTDIESERIRKITTSGAITEYPLPAYSRPYRIVEGPEKNMWFTNAYEGGAGKISKITPSGTITEYALSSEPSRRKPFGIAAGSDGNLWFTVGCGGGPKAIGKITPSGTITEYPLSPEITPLSIVGGGDGNLWFTAANYTTGESHIGKITTSGTITEYNIPGGAYEITAGPEKDIWFTESGYIGKITTSGTITKYPVFAIPWNHITEGPEGNLWYASAGSGYLGSMSPSGMSSVYSMPSEYETRGLTTGPDKNLWLSNYGEHKIEKINLADPSQGETYAPQSGSTINYNVPLEGAGAPQQMGANEETHKAEPAKWAQKDDPAYATAIFPPEEPQSWPATSYKRATTYYLDSQARTVNVASPSGGVATMEYNENNEIERALSPVNRAAALKEKEESKSAEVAELLSTKSTYNIEGQLEQTLGPQHNVKRSSGGEVLARNRVKYYYDEGAKEVEEKTHETYDLVTKTIDAAETASKEVFDERTTTTSYSGQGNLGWKLRTPTSVTTEPAGLDLTTTTKYEEETGNVIETQAPAASGKDAKVPLAYSFTFGSQGTAGGQFEAPEHDAVDSHGNIWVADYYNQRVQEFSSSGTFMLAIGWGVKDGKAEAETCTAECKAGISGSGNGQFHSPVGMAINQTSGNVYVTDYANNRVEELSSAGAYVASFGSKGSAGGQFSSPLGITIDSSSNVWVADYGNNRIQEMSSSGSFIRTFGWGVKDAKAEAETCTASCQTGIAGSGNGQLSGPSAVAFSGGNVYVTDYGNNRVEKFSTTGGYLSKFGSKGTGNGQFEGPHDIATEATSGDLYVVDKGNNRVQKFSTGGTFISKFGTYGAGNGQLEHPDGMTITSTGTVYISDSLDSRMEVWTLAITGNEGARNTKTIYYTAAANSEYPECGSHIEWTGLPCEKTPAAQPEDSPVLPVTTIAYNMWDQPETVTETFGTPKRTTKTTYDSARRPLTSEEISSTDQSLPKVTDKYSTTTGALETQSTKVGEATETITSLYNTLGELESYTDAAKNTAKYVYDEYGRLKEMSDGSNEGKSKQTYTYEETTGELTKLEDSAAKTFTATYDVGGRMTSEGYPNGMTAYYTYNSVGTATSLEYKKATNCGESCTWFSDAIVPSIHGEMLKQKSTLSEEPSYTYDAVGRLTQVQEIPTGGECTTRVYAYDEDANRTSLTTRTPNSKGECATEGGTTEWHTYDTADRLTDPGVVYETLGNATTLPASDAGGSELALTSSYYVDGQVYKQAQNKKEFEYKLDPEGRALETISSGNTAIAHYDGPGAALAWTAETGGKSTRNIPGIGGELAAIQTNGGTPELQLHDLQGDIVATAAMSETETKLLKKFNNTEFGVPTGKEPPPKYAWLGALWVASELSAGAITQDGATYVPQIGRALQTQGTAPPTPLNAATPFVSAIEPWVAETLAAGAAHQLLLAEQARQAVGGANTPPGAIPSPVGGGGGEDEEPGGGGGSGCSGMNACAASNHHHPGEHGDLNSVGCGVWATIHYDEESNVWGDGYFACGTPQAVFVIQVCVYVVGEEGGAIEKVQTGNLASGGACTKGDPIYGKSHGKTKAEISCELSENTKSEEFLAWVWGGEPNGRGGWKVQGTNWSEVTKEKDGWCNFL